MKKKQEQNRTQDQKTENNKLKEMNKEKNCAPVQWLCVFRNMQFEVGDIILCAKSAQIHFESKNNLSVP